MKRVISIVAAIFAAVVGSKLVTTPDVGEWVSSVGQLFNHVGHQLDSLGEGIGARELLAKQDDARLQAEAIGRAVRSSNADLVAALERDADALVEAKCSLTSQAATTTTRASGGFVVSIGDRPYFAVPLSEVGPGSGR